MNDYLKCSSSHDASTTIAAMSNDLRLRISNVGETAKIDWMLW
jgi:hypothetical protein